MLDDLIAQTIHGFKRFSISNAVNQHYSIKMVNPLWRYGLGRSVKIWKRALMITYANLMLHPEPPIPQTTRHPTSDTS